MDAGKTQTSPSDRVTVPAEAVGMVVHVARELGAPIRAGAHSEEAFTCALGHLCGLGLAEIKLRSHRAHLSGFKIEELARKP